MEISSRYNVNNHVWFLARQGNGPMQVFEGRVFNIERWDSYGGFMYSVQRLMESGGNLEYHVLEKDIYPSKEEAIEMMFVESEVPITEDEETKETAE